MTNETTPASEEQGWLPTGTYESSMLRAALFGNADAGRDALDHAQWRLRTGLPISNELALYLADRLHGVVNALDKADALREVKKSGGSIRSSRDAAIAEALCIKRPANRPADPMPDWQVPYAALGELLRRRGLRPEEVKERLDEARKAAGNEKGLDRREAGRIVATYKPLEQFTEEDLLFYASRLGKILPTFLPQTTNT
jgi:hypothetical protein